MARLGVCAVLVCMSAVAVCASDDGTSYGMKKTSPYTVSKPYMSKRVFINN